MSMSILEIKEVHVSYGHVKAVRGLSLRVEERTIVSLVGANGAGKSTLLKSIMGLVPVKSGDIRLEGAPIANDLTSSIVSKGIAMSPEGRRVFPRLSVLENLTLGAYTQRERAGVREDLERMFSYFPILKARRKQRAGSLSGGEQQMLAIARALMAKPRILLLDEPSLGLAPLLVNLIGEIILQLHREGCTLLLVEQNARMALKLADYAYVLETGKVVLEDAGDKLLQNDHVVRAYLGG
jgi:branched-chain amino acid transport system ATP-binding protein